MFFIIIVLDTYGLGKKINVVFYGIIYIDMKGRRKTGKDLIRSLTKSSGGTSYSITLPIAVVRKFRWNKHQKLQLPVDEKGEKIVIEDWPTK